MFSLLRDIRAKDQHCVIKYWPLRTELKPGDKNVIANPLVPKDKIIFPPLHIKLQLMKHFVKLLIKKINVLSTCLIPFQALA